MDAIDLPFDATTMLRGIRSWVECESPTWDAAAVNRMTRLAARELAALDAQIETIAGRMGFGDCLRACLPHPRKDAPGILILGHMDTVHPLGTLARLSFREQDGRCYGPGILDMKGGNYLAVEAIRQLRRAGMQTPLPVTVLFTSDEEVGSPSTRDLIEKEAARQRYVLIPEPARADGSVVTGRYAIARFNLEAVGRPSHAGLRLTEGRSAIRAMARKILEIEAMTTESCTFSVGVVHGGEWVNCVPRLCLGEVLSMAKRQSDLDQGVKRMLALAGTADDVTFTVKQGVTRPVWEPNPATLALYETARRLASAIGFEIGHQMSGGGSDGNFTGAMGIATLDGLGASGGGQHTLGENIEIESLALRGRLFAALLSTII